MRRALLLAAVLAAGCSRPAPRAAEGVDAFGTLGRQPGQLSRPRAVAVNRQNEIIVVDRTGRIQALDLKTGEFLRQWRLPAWDNGTPTGIAVDPTDDSLWVADTHYQQVLQYDREGRLLSRFGERGEDPGQMIFPTDLCLDLDGKTIWVCEYGRRNRIMEFTREGKFVKEWGTPLYDNRELERPMAIRLSPDGRELLVADAGNHRVNAYSREGKLLRQFGKAGTGPGELKYPYDLALAPDNTLWIVEYGNSRVSRWSLSGEWLGSFGGPGHGAGELATPWGCAVAGNGDLVVADTNNQRVQVLRAR